MSKQTETPPSALSDDDFVDRVITEYLDLYDEIEDGDRAEHDLMPRVVEAGSPTLKHEPSGER